MNTIERETPKERERERELGRERESRQNNTNARAVQFICFLTVFHGSVVGTVRDRPIKQD